MTRAFFFWYLFLLLINEKNSLIHISDRIYHQQVRPRARHRLGLARHDAGRRQGHEAPLRAARQEDMRGKRPRKANLTSLILNLFCISTCNNGTMVWRDWVVAVKHVSTVVIFGFTHFSICHTYSSSHYIWPLLLSSLTR